LPVGGIQGFTNTWLAAKAYEGDGVVIHNIVDSLPNCERKNFSTLLASVQDGVLTLGGAKFIWIDRLLAKTISGAKATQSVTLSKFDRIATDPTFGKPLAIFILILGLVLSFVPATPIMLLGGTIPKLATPINMLLSAIPQFIIDFITQVILNTLYFAVAMIGFVFGANLVFGIIEEVGYMARISYVFDNIMTRLDLQGKAIIPFVVSFGCTIGGAAGLNHRLGVGCTLCRNLDHCASIVHSLFRCLAPLVIVFIFLIAWLHMILTAKVFGPKLVHP
jgi:ferrous iron transport protein B